MSDPGGVWRERHEQRRLNVEALGGLIEGFADIQLKFVVADAADLAEIDGLMARLPELVPDDILLMPEGVTVPRPEDVRWVLEACRGRGWRYSHRLHVELFGNTRGT